MRLSPNTLARIFKGLEGFCGIPFVIGAGGPQGAGAPVSIDSPLRTILTDDHKALVHPFLVKYYGALMPNLSMSHCRPSPQTISTTAYVNH
jgi:hypothetical protein